METRSQADAEATLLKPQVATRFEWNRNTDTPLPPDEPAGENPQDGAIIHYFLKQPSSGSVSIEILDGTGKVVRRYSSDDKPVEIRDEGNVPAYWIRPSPVVSTDAGLHRFVWDLHYPPVPGAPEYPIAATPHDTAPGPKGPWVVPGTYTVKLTVAGKAYTQPLTVRVDPRVKVGPAALQKQFTLSKRLYDALFRIEEVLPKIAEARERAQAAGKADVAQTLSTLAGTTDEGRGRGRGSTGSTQPTLTTIAGELSALYSLSQDGSELPPTQTVTAAEDALKRYTAIMTQVTPLLH